MRASRQRVHTAACSPSVRSSEPVREFANLIARHLTFGRQTRRQLPECDSPFSADLPPPYCESATLADHAPVTGLSGLRSITLEMSDRHCEIDGLALRNHHSDLIDPDKIEVVKFSVRIDDVPKRHPSILRKQRHKSVTGKRHTFL